MVFKSSEKVPESDSEDDEMISPAHAIGRDDILIIATHGNIYAVRKQDGSRLWRKTFPTGAGGGVVSLFITDRDRLVVGATGKTASLDLYTGKTFWVNQMMGCGYDEVGAIVTPSRIAPPRSSSSTYLQSPDGEDRDLLPPRYAESTSSESHEAVGIQQIVIACTDGKCMAIDMDTGKELWLFKCPKGGFKLSTAIFDPTAQASQEEGGSGAMGHVYIGCGSMLYCLDARSGQVAWSTRISNTWAGFDYLTMATAWSSRCAAESYTGFNQFPSAQQHHALRTRRNGIAGMAVSWQASSSASPL